MTDNKNSPAFPTITWDQINGHFVQVTECSGVSKLEFIACNAPFDIPSWFIHLAPEKPDIKAPDWEEIKIVEDRNMVRGWVSDPCFDLPDHLQWFSDKTREATSAYYDWLNKDKATRYFQWRRYYAEQLLLTLSKP